ncbi:MAG: general secretion pathway protein [Deltaproteobacteria bacterium]|nr:general secretion pathway protein [Deltaproteobacteria bacterium]
MYEVFYGLRSRPFGKSPDPAFLYASPGHAEALARLITAAEDRDLAVLTGAVGLGKTTLTRALVDGLAARFGGQAHVVLLVNPRVTSVELLDLLAERLGVTVAKSRSRVRLLDGILARLYDIHAGGGLALLIVDEAHLLPSRAVFEELRLLLNLTLDDMALLGLLLVGQEELRARLGKKDLRALAQRVGVAFHLEPFDRPEVARYVEHRLAVAGRVEPLFTEDAVDALHRVSDGVPRRINVLAQASLLVGFGLEAARIDAAIVDDVWNDLRSHLGAAFAGGR